MSHLFFYLIIADRTQGPSLLNNSDSSGAPDPKNLKVKV